jgi:hypothetical protein
LPKARTEATATSDKLLFIIYRTIGDAKIVHLAAVSMSYEVRKLVESGKEFLLIYEIAAKLGQSAFNIILPTDKEITQTESVLGLIRFSCRQHAVGQLFFCEQTLEEGLRWAIKRRTAVRQFSSRITASNWRTGRRRRG